jgi:hypothetical protein
MMTIVQWFEGTTLVVRPDGRRRLWLVGGRLHDDRGVASEFDPLLIPTTVYALAIYVGEWLVRRCDRDGPTPSSEIHPVLRAAVRQLAPGVVTIDGIDDGEDGLWVGASGLH